MKKIINTKHKKNCKVGECFLFFTYLFKKKMPPKKQNAYYVRILYIAPPDLHGKTSYQVQFIDNDIQFVDSVHDHMINKYKKWKKDNPKMHSRPPMTPYQLQEAKTKIEYETEICNGKKITYKKDDINKPQLGINGSAIWCDLCLQWHDAKCIETNLPLDNKKVYKHIVHSVGNDNAKSLFLKIVSIKNVHEENEILNYYYSMAEENYIKLKDEDKEAMSKEIISALSIMRLTNTKNDNTDSWLDDTLINEAGSERAKQNPEILHIDSQLVVSININSKTAEKIKEKLNNEKYIFIPYNEGATHWVLFVILLKEKGESIFYLDSLKDKNKQLPRHIKDFLKVIFPSPRSFEEKPIEIKLNHYQKDSNSCGLYVAHFMQTFDLENLTSTYYFPKWPRAKILLNLLIKRT